MRPCTIIAALLTTAAAVGQSPLTTTFTSNGGGPPGGQVLFDLTVFTTVTLTRLDVNLGDAPGTTGTIDIYLTPGTHVGVTGTPGAWTLAGSGTVTAQGIDTPSPLAIGAGIVLAPGSYGVALHHVGVAYRRTSGSAVYSTAEMSLTTGGVQNVPWGTFFVPRQLNGSIHYLPDSVAGPFVLATVESYGSGCAGLTLAATGSPMPGGAVTMQTTGVAGTATIGATVYGFSSLVPGTALTALGAPACFQHLVPVATVLDFAPAPSFADVLPIPLGPGLLGVSIFGQSAVLDPGIAAGGLASSNGIALTIGNV